MWDEWMRYAVIDRQYTVAAMKVDFVPMGKANLLQVLAVKTSGDQFLNEVRKKFLPVSTWGAKPLGDHPRRDK
jgi:hypothetical protein